MNDQYYAIVASVGIIGITSYDGIENVIIEDGTHCRFIEVTNDEAESYSCCDEEWDDPSSAKYQEVMTRPQFRAEFKMCLVQD